MKVGFTNQQLENPIAGCLPERLGFIFRIVLPFVTQETLRATTAMNSSQNTEVEFPDRGVTRHASPEIQRSMPLMLF